MSRKILFASVALALALAGVACADEVQLYGATAYVRANTSNQMRAQLFSPTTSVPNSLLSTDLFYQAGFKIQTRATDDFTFNLGIYNYSGNASAPVGTLIAERIGIRRVGVTEDWEMVSFSPLPASGSYVLLLTATAFTTSEPTDPGWRMLYLPTNSGGPGNDAYASSAAEPTVLVLRTDREYDVKLTLVPEPGSLFVLLNGLAALGGWTIIRRK